MSRSIAILIYSIFRLCFHHMANLTYKVTDKGGESAILSSYHSSFPHHLSSLLSSSLCSQLLIITLTSYTVVQLISNKAGLLCPSFVFWRNDISCYMTYTHMTVISKRAVGEHGYEQEWQRYWKSGQDSGVILLFGSSHTIKPDPNCAFLSEVILFVFNLLWAIHRTMACCWNGLLAAYSLLGAGSKGPLKVRIRSYKVWLLYWPQTLSNGLWKTPPNPVFVCKIDLLTTWRE